MPEKVAELTALMAKIINDGRSTAGAKQANTGLTPFLPHEPKMSQVSEIDTAD